MDLTKLTLSEFMCADTAVMREDLPGAFDKDRDSLRALVGEVLRELDDCYSLNRINTRRDGDVALLYKGELVGYYYGDTIAIADAHTGKSLSVPMILEGVKYRTLPASREHSMAGKKAFEKAWRVANGQQENPWP